MKKKILSVALIISLIAIAAMGTLAYFTDTKTAHNEISMGNVGIELHETDGEGNVFVDPVGVMPGDEIAKVVTIENTGANSVWVRVFIIPALFDAEDNQIPFPEDLIAFDVGDTWFYDDITGAWYYNFPLEKGTETAPILTNVSFNIAMGNEYMNAILKVDVYAQAVQSDNNGETVFDAVGWPDPPAP